MIIIIAFSLLLLGGCSVNTVYLYTYNVEQEQKYKIIEELKSKEFEVAVMDDPPPLLELGSFIIYPKPPNDNDALEDILNVIQAEGFSTGLIAKNKVTTVATYSI